MLKKSKTLLLAQFSILLSLEALVCFTPLGSIPIPGIAATLMCVPVIIAAITLGTAAGAAMGFAAGIFSLIVWTFMPPNPAIAFVFTPFYSAGGYFRGNFFSLCICVIPRALVGAISGALFKPFARAFKKRDVFAYTLSGALGSLTNTFLVLGGTYVFFGRAYAEAYEMAYELLLGAIGMVVLTNGVAEAIIGAAAAYAVCKPLNKYIIKIGR